MRSETARSPNRPWSSRALRATGPQRSFTGESLREIAFPLGGIGAGTISLGGRGQLVDWEIFNRPAKGRNLPYTFFSIYAEESGAAGVARVLERRLLPPYSGGFGLPTASVSGLPRLREAVFRGEYPFAWIQYLDDALPVEIDLEAFNPLIPMNDLDSGLPLAVFRWRLTNRARRKVGAAVACSLLNAVGYNGSDVLGGRHNTEFGRNLNQWRADDAARGVFMSGKKHARDSAQYGTIALASTWPDTTFKARWPRAGWWDDVQAFWDEFTRGRGSLPGPAESDPSPDAQTDVATLGLRVSLNPGESATLPFLLAWHFPNLTNTWNRHQEAALGKRLGNWYATQWEDAWAVAQYAAQSMDRLEAETRAYHAALFGSTMPQSVIDAVGSNVSILRTATVLRTEDGRMNGFEGCSDNEGCCPMNCTHVWNYEQTAAHLFPALERSVRLTDFQHNTRPDGSMAFRTLLPMSVGLWAHPPAADGQMGTVMKAYREWLQCGDIEFLHDVWPGVAKALEHAWAPDGWDADRDGVMEGEQHNTYDIEFYGANTMTGTLYLGALRAAEEMAKALGERAAAAKYRAMYRAGRAAYSAQTWNGEFFAQTVNAGLWRRRHGPESGKAPPEFARDDQEPRYQYGAGCLSDQLLGQWFARVVGLGDLLPRTQIRAALAAIVRHNWRADLSAHATVQRVYAVNDEAGLLLCTWPDGGRPAYPFPYADEVWTGIEYQVAAHCIYEGLIDEGLAIVRGVRDRHDGAKRNPWDECECGHHYARAMSSWSLLLALSGYRYDAAPAYLAFAPRIHREGFRCFFAAGTAWGVFTQRVGKGSYAAAIEPRWGEISLRRVGLPLRRTARVRVSINGTPIEAHVEKGEVNLSDTHLLRAGDVLAVQGQD